MKLAFKLLEDAGLSQSRVNPLCKLLSQAYNCVTGPLFISLQLWCSVTLRAVSEYSTPSLLSTKPKCSSSSSHPTIQTMSECVSLEQCKCRTAFTFYIHYFCLVTLLGFWNKQKVRNYSYHLLSETELAISLFLYFVTRSSNALSSLWLLTT